MQPDNENIIANHYVSGHCHNRHNNAERTGAGMRLLFLSVLASLKKENPPDVVRGKSPLINGFFPEEKGIDTILQPLPW